MFCIICLTCKNFLFVYSDLYFFPSPLHIKIIKLSFIWVLCHILLWLVIGSCMKFKTSASASEIVFPPNQFFRFKVVCAVLSAGIILLFRICLFFFLLLINKLSISKYNSFYIYWELTVCWVYFKALSWQRSFDDHIVIPYPPPFFFLQVSLRINVT